VGEGVDRRAVPAPKEKEANGVKDVEIDFGESSVRTVIHHYTKEAGVRNLEREILDGPAQDRQGSGQAGQDTKFKTAGQRPEISRGAQVRSGKPEERDEIGLCNWAGGDHARRRYSAVGGHVLPGKGKVTLTGKLGDVMQESAHAAMSYIRSRPSRSCLERDFYAKMTRTSTFRGRDSQGRAVAGVTMATALCSALLRVPVRPGRGR